MIGNEPQGSSHAASLARRGLRREILVFVKSHAQGGGFGPITPVMGARELEEEFWISPQLVALSARHAVRFGVRLFDVVGAGNIGFDEVEQVASEMVRESPRAAAEYLAVLVALDMHRTWLEARRQSPPDSLSLN